jgi:hypothetical protein
LGLVSPSACRANFSASCMYSKSVIPSPSSA